MTFVRTTLALVCAVLAGCASHAGAWDTGVPIDGVLGGNGEPQSSVRADALSAQRKKIKHVVVVMQENRSFDNLFQGFPGADTVSSGKNSKGKTIRLKPVPLEAPWNIDHRSKTFFAACDGTSRGRDCKMDGFDRELTFGSGKPKNLPYSYVPHDETRPYFEIGKQYVVGDNMFPSNLDESFESHQYIIAGQSNHAVDEPNGTEGCDFPSASVRTLKDNRHYGPWESPCFDYRTIADELDAKGLPWKYFASGRGDLGYIWSAYQAVDHIYHGPDWKADVITPPSAFFKHVQAGELAAVTWITPTCATSDHPDCLSNQGPDWVAGIVNAVGESSFWDSTAIFVMWDEWGGWYDHVPPPYVDYDGLGIRVPLLVVAAYAKKGYVSHVLYEHGSILKFIEDTFGLTRLAASDTRANSPTEDCFDFSQAPRAFHPIRTKLTVRDSLQA